MVTKYGRALSRPPRGSPTPACRPAALRPSPERWQPMRGPTLEAAAGPHRPLRRRPARVVVALLAAGALTGAGLVAATGAGAAIPAPPSGWTTVFADDFTGGAGSGVNTTNWQY